MRRGITRFRLRAPVVAIAATVVLAAFAGAALGRPAATVQPVGDWLSFGRTPDNARFSPLTQITPANVDQLGRVYTVDFLRLDPDTRRGQQSYPLAIGGTLYVTTNDANVFAIDGATGKILWQRKPPNSALFKNFGIVANRGLSYCGGKLFILQLDMKLVSIDPKDGSVLGEVALSQDIPNATANYGYSETSTPICANNRLVFGAAGSERGNRGFVMAYTTNLKPAWPTPFWTIPPDLQSWRRGSRLVGGGPVWTPVTIDTTTNTVYFGTGSATPVYYPALRPGPNPRTSSLIAVNLSDGRMKWWRELIRNNQWEYDVAQPPLVYNTTIGGQRHRVVSVATKEGTWFAFDAATGRPFHERVKVIDRVEHPPLKPGQPVTIFPGSIGGLNYSPAAYDPKTNYVFNAAAETAGVLIQDRLSPTQKKRKLLLGDVYLGLSNGTFGAALASWKDHGSISAINVSTGRRVWKFDTPEPERGGVTATASGLGFAGGGDGVLRAFDLKTGKVLWTFQTGRQIAAGPTLFTAGGKEYIAITVGGTPTSSGGGLASQLQVFAIGGSKVESPKPLARDGSGRRRSPGVGVSPSTGARATARSLSARTTTPRAARIVIQGGAVPLTLWNAEHVEPRQRRREAPVRRRARRRREDRRRPLHAPGGDRQRRPLHLPGRLDPRAAASGVRRRHESRTARRQGAHDGAAARGARGDGRDQRRVPGDRRVGRRPPERDRGRARPRGPVGRRPRAAGRAPLLPARGQDHGRRGQSRARRDRRHAHERPRLLDLLRAERRERPLHGLLPRVRQDGERPRGVRGAGRERPDVLHDGRAKPDLQAARELEPRPAPARLGHDDGAPDGGHDAGGDLSRPARRRLGAERGRQARLGHLAGRAGPLHARPARLGEGLDAAVLAERLPVVHDRRGAGRPGRPRDLADEAVSPRLPRHRLRARPPLAGRPARRTALARDGN